MQGWSTCIPRRWWATTNWNKERG